MNNSPAVPLRAVRPGWWALVLFVLVVVGLCRSVESAAQTNQTPAERDSIIAAAREIIGLQTYCGLVTIDSTGQPQARTMNPFPPEEDMTVWMATNSRSRKVAEIRNNPRVCLYYADHGKAVGSVCITGKAVLVDDMSEKLKRKREYWSQAFPDWKYLVLIKVVPERIDVVNYKRGMANEPLTWRTPHVEFGKK